MPAPKTGYTPEEIAELRRQRDIERGFRIILTDEEVEATRVHARHERALVISCTCLGAALAMALLTAIVIGGGQW
jgi:hypothetical protein